ncbi:transcriptional repressor LexA [Castellaniella hirudinis]|uniref:transcriptional repressor LexA n=1 Tax=Castellaniella hirudinis TaxID=1144617 RepID=UPI0039C2C3B1
MSTKLTARQSQILALVVQAIQQDGRPPTRAEIAHALGFKSANAAEDHLRALAKKGYITLVAGTSRGIQPTTLAGEARGQASPPAPAAGRLAAPPSPQRSGVPAAWGAPHRHTLPLIGRVAAGHPILAAEHIEAEIHVSAHLFTSPPDYLLRVRGSSMRDIGILDGDLLAVRSTPEAHHGQVIVARLGDDVTVKRLDHQGPHIRLLPENPDFSPIVITAADDFAIEGIAVGLIRTGNLH